MSKSNLGCAEVVVRGNRCDVAQQLVVGDVNWAYRKKSLKFTIERQLPSCSFESRRRAAVEKVFSSAVTCCSITTQNRQSQP